MHEAPQELLALLQRPHSQHLAESPKVGQRVARGGLEIDGVVVDALQIGEAGSKGLTLRPDLAQALVDKVAVRRSGDVQQSVGFGVERRQVGLDLGDLLTGVRHLGQQFLRDEPPKGRLPTSGEILPEALLDPLQDEGLEWVAP